jgi:hypothetical protein
MSNEDKPRGRPRKATTGRRTNLIALDGEGRPPVAPRNTAADRDFIDAHPDQFLHSDGSLVWTGRATDIGHPYQLPPPHMRCTHTRIMHDDDGGAILDVDRNPLKDRCPKWSMMGADRCVDHAKGSKAVMDAVRERIVNDSNVFYQELRRIALDGNAADSDRIKALNSLLDRGGLKAGVEVSADEDSWGRLYDRIAGKVTEESA